MESFPVSKPDTSKERRTIYKVEEWFCDPAFLPTDSEIHSWKTHVTTRLLTGEKLHEPAKKMAGSNLRGKVIAALITACSCSEMVTFCPQTHPALGMLDLASKKIQWRKRNPLFRSFQAGPPLNSEVTSWILSQKTYTSYHPKLFQLNLTKKERGCYFTVVFQSITECYS